MFDLNGIPDITGDGKSDMLDAFILNEMINDTEEQEEIEKKLKGYKNKKNKK